MHGDVAQPARPGLKRYLRRALALLRWVTLAVLLAIVGPTRGGLHHAYRPAS